MDALVGDIEFLGQSLKGETFIIFKRGEQEEFEDDELRWGKNMAEGFEKFINKADVRRGKSHSVLRRLK